MRCFLTIIACLLLVPNLARAQEPTHGLSLFGTGRSSSQYRNKRGLKKNVLDTASENLVLLDDSSDGASLG